MTSLIETALYFVITIVVILWVWSRLTKQTMGEVAEQIKELLAGTKDKVKK